MNSPRARVHETRKGVVGHAGYWKQISEMFAWKVFTSKINFRNIYIARLYMFARTIFHDR